MCNEDEVIDLLAIICSTDICIILFMKPNDGKYVVTVCLQQYSVEEIMSFYVFGALLWWFLVEEEKVVVAVTLMLLTVLILPFDWVEEVDIPCLLLSALWLKYLEYF